MMQATGGNQYQGPSQLAGPPIQKEQPIEVLAGIVTERSISTRNRLQLILERLEGSGKCGPNSSERPSMPIGGNLSLTDSNLTDAERLLSQIERHLFG